MTRLTRKDTHKKWIAANPSNFPFHQLCVVVNRSCVCFLDVACSAIRWPPSPVNPLLLWSLQLYGFGHRLSRKVGVRRK